MANLSLSIARRLTNRLLVEGAKDRDKAIELEMEWCRRDINRWMDQWVWTYNPKNAGTQLPALLPFDMFPRQRAYMAWLDARQEQREDGLFEKSRDVGATWLCAAWAVHKWLFVPGHKTTFGSRTQDLVDKKGDPDSIFEKIRQLLRELPRWMLPKGYSSHEHDNFLQLTNPQNGNTITGKAGEEMGRGGRSSTLFIDEAAFLQAADSVDAASSANSDVRIWVSSANGIGNFFHRLRFSGRLTERQIFRLHWRDDERKTEEWAARKKASMEEHKWASEYDIDYSASVEGICIPGKYVDAAMLITALLIEKRGVHLQPTATGIAGLDVGGGGKAKSVAAARFGPIVTVPESWGDPDTNETAARCLDYAEAQSKGVVKRADGTVCKVTMVNYDSVGVGHGALGIMSRGRPGIQAQGINTGVPPMQDRTWPDGLTSKEKFANLKAELWFLARERFKATWEMQQFLLGADGGQEHPITDLIALPPLSAGPDMPILAGQLSSVKWGRNEKGKTIIESKQSLAKRGVASPDHADALMLTFGENNVVDEWRRAFG